MKYINGKLELWDTSKGKAKNKEILFDGVGFKTFLEFQNIVLLQEKTYKCEGIKIKKIFTAIGYYYGVSYVYDIEPIVAKKMYEEYLKSKYYKLINKKRLLSIDSRDKAYSLNCGIYKENNGDFDLVNDINNDNMLQIKDMSFKIFLDENVGLNDAYLKIIKGKQIYKDRDGNNVISKISNYLYDADLDIMLADLSDYSNSLESLFELLYTKNIKHIPNLVNSMNISESQYKKILKKELNI